MSPAEVNSTIGSPPVGSSEYFESIAQGDDWTVLDKAEVQVSWHSFRRDYWADEKNCISVIFDEEKAVGKYLTVRESPWMLKARAWFSKICSFIGL
jgi:hypothetical protein